MTDNIEHTGDALAPHWEGNGANAALITDAGFFHTSPPAPKK